MAVSSILHSSRINCDAIERATRYNASRERHGRPNNTLNDGGRSTIRSGQENERDGAGKDAYVVVHREKIRTNDE
jgi:hypothetical protein